MDPRLEGLLPRLQEWLCGDADAVRFACALWEASQEWDDVEDEGAGAHNDVLNWMAFEQMRDPFLRGNAHILQPALLQFYLDWQAANAFERAGSDLEKAWMLRAGLYRVLHVVAWLIGGHAHAVRVGPEIWRCYGETLDDFKKEMADG